MKWSAVVGVLALLVACGGSETTSANDGGARDAGGCGGESCPTSCDPNPCQNDGTCQADAAGVRGVCRAGFGGAMCQDTVRLQCADGEDTDDVLTPTAVVFH